MHVKRGGGKEREGEGEGGREREGVCMGQASYSCMYITFRLIYLRTVDCFDTCITGVNPTPLQCCASSILRPDTMSVTTNLEFNYQIARLHAPDEPTYRLNAFCKYKISFCTHILQCKYFMFMTPADTIFSVQMRTTIFTTPWCDSVLSLLMQMAHV